MSFDPTAEGALTDSWSITANDGLGARTITVAGTGLAPLAPTVSVDWLNLVRPSSGTATATFALSLSAPSPSTTSVTVRTLDGTATVAHGDYVPISGRVVTFAPGQIGATVAVTVNGKVAVHSYFGLQVLAPKGLLVADDYGRANLLGQTDQGHEFVYVGPAQVIQNAAYPQTAEVPVTASPHTDTITCTVNTADGTATAAEGDYTAVAGGTVTLGSGVTGTTVPVSIPPGTSIQPNRQFTVTLGACSPSNDVAEDPTGVVTINGAAGPTAPTVTLGPLSQSVMAGQQVTFTAGADASPPPTVQWLSEAPGATSFSAVIGATSTTYTFSPTLPQSGTELEAVFTNALGSVTTPPATLTVTPGTALALSTTALAFGSVPDGITESHTFIVTNTSASDLTITAAAPPTDGQGFAAATTLPVGTVLAAGASLPETVAFTPGSQASLSDSWSITANDGLGAHVITFAGTGTAPLTPTVTVDWLNLVRPSSGTATATFALSLSAPSPSTTSVTVRTLDGTATVANGDYVPIPRTAGDLRHGPEHRNRGGYGQWQSRRPQLLRPPGACAERRARRGRLRARQPARPHRSRARVRLRGAGRGHAGSRRPAERQGSGYRQPPHRHHHLHGEHSRWDRHRRRGRLHVHRGRPVTFAPGVTTTTVPVNIPASTIVLPKRTFTVTLSNCSTNAVAADLTGVVTIVG